MMRGNRPWILIVLQLALIVGLAVGHHPLAWWADIAQSASIILLCLPQWKPRRKVTVSEAKDCTICDL